MSSNIKVEFSGLDKLFAQFESSKGKARNVTASAMKATVAKAQQTSQKVAPHRTGYLRNNIMVKPVKISGDTVTGEYDANADYSSFVEDGTYKMRAQPFMRPGVAAAKPFFYSTVEAALRGVM
ncbi:HK97-gp10 family putative phage morphogenesis protein [Lactobacillus sp. UCMA15818]|uniref:HK97-gp10 family putative phage morphogenesis protein n=1 Tax=Lactobacillus sp. UCMA15818 TaxID=2583394 RepID=UPI0025B0A943|nr:HK97-gp10 family putative phage morphogenesis protein [Lactobacillus sp. UCMA15818]MDN2452525.1 hypothetical protein [Lactobacillus sp. UCMA15818]